MKKSVTLTLAIILCALCLSTQSIALPKAEARQVLNLYSWVDNFDPKIISEFERRYKCRVNYDVFANNEELFAKLRAGGAQYDIIQPSDYMVARMIKLDMLERLNLDNMPNVKRLKLGFEKPPYDPNNEYSIVYMWGITGIAYNKKYVKEAPVSWADLWKDEYKGRVVLLDDSREVFGMALRKNGFSNSTKNQRELEIAFNDLKRLAPNVLAYDTDTIKQKFIAEEAWIGTVWSGDAILIMEENPNIGFALAKEHGVIWTDNFAIPKGARNKVLAEQFINFIYDPKISERNYEYTGYFDPSREYADDEIFQMCKAAFADSEWLVDAGEALPLYDRYWTELKTIK